MPWLLVAAAAQVAAFEVVRRGFIGTVRGQLVDTAALDASVIGRRHIDGLVDAVLGTVTVLSVLAAVAAIGFVALIRRQAVLAAAATLLIVGANLTTQVLKQVLVRPDYGVDLERAVAGNSLPSGHATVAGSVAVALVLVLPPRLRGAVAVLGTGFAALVGVATLSADWHRPSDSVAALLVVGGWAAVAGLVLALASGRSPEEAAGPGPPRSALAILALAGGALLAVAAVALALTDRALADQALAGQDLATRVGQLGRGRLLVAYAGGAAGIAGVASAVVALALLTAHLTVPGRRRRSGAPGRPAAHPASASAGPPG